MKRTLHFFMLLFLCQIMAQNHCGQDHESIRIYGNATQSEKEHINEMQQYLDNYSRTFQSQNITRAPEDTGGLIIGTDYIIPTVVHIIHNGGGASQIDTAEVERAIEMLNHFFSGKSAYDELIDPDFVAVRGAFTNKKIKFVLANYDPVGNPTSGVTFNTDATYAAAGQLEQMRRNYNWPRANYFNIYVVDGFSDGSYSGFATFPFSVDNDPEIDGHVMQYWAFGEQDNCWETWYHNLAHEVGHWLNLYHIWSYLDQDCFNDDDVTDTPNTDGNVYGDFDDFPGVGAITTCSTKDNITNMMDYTSAFYAMFTDGQRIRMEAALNSSVAQRNNLWTTTNVLNTIYGCTGGPDSDADNIPDACDDCPNDANNDSDGDGVCDSNDLCNGYPDVDVDAFAGTPDACDPLAPIINFNTYAPTTYDTGQDSGVHDVYDNGATIYISNNGWKGIDYTYNVTSNTVLEFDFKSTIEGEIHYIGFDTDNALPSNKRYMVFGRDAFPDAEVSTDYNTYNSLNDWEHFSIPIGNDFTGNITKIFFTADADVRDNNAGYYNDGTSFFRNVKIYENTLLSSPTEDVLATTIFPNPFSNTITIKSELDLKNAVVNLTDITGKTIFTEKIMNTTNQHIMNTNTLASGVYMLIINNGTYKTIKKVVKK